MPLSEHPLQTYLGPGLQIADIIEWGLEQMGPADVFVSPLEEFHPEQELELARVGSPLAVQMASSYMLNMDMDE